VVKKEKPTNVETQKNVQNLTSVETRKNAQNPTNVETPKNNFTITLYKDLFVVILYNVE